VTIHQTRSMASDAVCQMRLLDSILILHVSQSVMVVTSRHTLQISTCAECSASACENADT
jgi:hypothetical protein